MIWVKDFAHNIHEKYFEKHRRNKESKQKIDHTMTAIGALGPFATMLQVLHIFSTKVVAGISPATWFGYLFVTTCWIFYGFFAKNKPLLFVNSLSFIMNIGILTGCYLYR